MLHQETKSRWFPTLALITALMTLGLIVFGAVVRVTDSGLGCGNTWPLCNGTIFPPLDNLTAWIEWLHRLFAALIGLFGLATLALAIRAYRHHNRAVLTATAVAAVLFVIQSGLGALVVVLDLPPTMVTLHLGTAMLLLAALQIAALFALYRPKISYPRDRFTSLGIVTTILALVIILTGALVRGSGATLACIDWPLCNGEVLPFAQGQLATIHMFHRFAVLALGVALVLLIWQAYAARSSRAIRILAAASLAAYLMQAGIGAMYVIERAAPIWGASHVAFAAVTWGLLVALSAIDLMNSRDKQGENASQWQPQSTPAAN
ncbi:heme A synthase [Anaerolineae bacterium CFX9]|jgi:heme A synthase|nr:heme A synthase [Anaerolineae bacterium CFX9]